MTPSKQEQLLQDLQRQHRFKQPLQYYQMGVSGKPEAQEQKAFIQFLMAEFPQELGFTIYLDKNGYEDVLYCGLVVATADFYDSQAWYTPEGKRISNKMQKMKQMGYQGGTVDIMVHCRRPAYVGFAVEAKSLTGKATRRQELTLQHLQTQGFYIAVCQGYAKMVEAWMDFLKRAE